MWTSWEYINASDVNSVAYPPQIDSRRTEGARSSTDSETIHTLLQLQPRTQKIPQRWHMQLLHCQCQSHYLHREFMSNIPMYCTLSARFHTHVVSTPIYLFTNHLQINLAGRGKLLDNQTCFTPAQRNMGYQTHNMRWQTKCNTT